MFTTAAIAGLVIGVVAYLQIGFQIRKHSWRIWEKKDSSTLTSFFLFPITHYYGDVGGNSALICNFNDYDMPKLLYDIFVTLFWPLKLAFNALVIIPFLGPEKALWPILSFLKPLFLEKKPVELPIQQDQQPSSPEETLAELEKKKEELGQKIIEVKTDIEIAEVERKKVVRLPQGQKQ